ncbi:MAG: peptidoglycan editing factor PgeF [Gammaproteobacteria bacterium]|nr:peptidoglycan editing factor PgeF [Gammaproteobacteria bacterium]
MIYPDWPAPDTIKAISTTRQGGFSLPPYSELNLGDHVGDNADSVAQNRESLILQEYLPEAPRWLKQVHGTTVSIASTWQQGDEADAIISDHINQVCSIMTADCLPILLCNQEGDQVAAVHAGWRSLAAGLIEKTVAHFNCPSHEIIAWLGPAIGPSQFEVGNDVYHTFTSHSPHADLAFQQTDSNHYLANIYLLAKQRLNALGVHAIFGGERCTVSEPAHFFSYRRDGITGRMASMIWITPK